MIAFHFILILFVSNLFVSEYRKLLAFNALKNREGVYVQLSEVQSIDRIKTLISEDAEFTQIYEYTGEPVVAEEHAYAVHVIGMDRIDYSPYLLSGCHYSEAEISDERVPVICSDNVSGVGVGDTLVIEGISCCVTGIFDFSADLPGNQGSYAEGNHSYTDLYREFDFESGEEYYSWAYDYGIDVIGDYNTLSSAGIRFSETDKFFLIYDDGISRAVIDGDVDAVDSFVKENSGLDVGVLGTVTIDAFFAQSNRMLFQNVGKFIPLLAGSILIMISGMICMVFVNTQQNERRIAIMRLTGYKKRHIFLLGNIQSVYLILTASLLAYIAAACLKDKYISREFLHPGAVSVICLCAFCLIIFAVCSLLPLKEVKSKTIAEMISLREWS